MSCGEHFGRLADDRQAAQTMGEPHIEQHRALKEISHEEFNIRDRSDFRAQLFAC
jgi:hypothetical protein